MWTAKTDRNSDTQKNYCNYPKIWQMDFPYSTESKNADRIANSVLPGSALFVQTHLSENLGSLQFTIIKG